MPTRVSGEAVCGGACFKGQHSPRGRRTRWRGSPGRSQTLPRDWPRRCERCAVAAASTSWGAARERGANGARGGHGATPKVATAKKNTAVQFFAPRATILRISQGKRTRPQKTAVQFFFCACKLAKNKKSGNCSRAGAACASWRVAGGVGFAPSLPQHRARPWRVCVGAAREGWWPPRSSEMQHTRAAPGSRHGRPEGMDVGASGPAAPLPLNARLLLNGAGRLREAHAMG